jgi:hypothetical protein
MLIGDVTALKCYQQVRAYCLPRAAFIRLPVYDKLELGGQLIEGLVLWQVQRKAGIMVSSQI